ncbi:MAG: NUDIX domain-containing protein [Acidimicrobiales bacterium]
MLPRKEYLAQLPRKVAGAGALITDARGGVLLVKPTYKAAWGVPGGIVEHGESARDACVRELAEELGLQLHIGQLLVIEHQTLTDDKGDSIMFVYDAGVLVDVTKLSLPGDELEVARFVETDELDAYLPKRQSRRMRAAVDARAAGTMIEMVDGERVGTSP